MTNDPAAIAQQKDIGEMLLQSDRWSMITDKILKLGYPITGIARMLLEEDKEIADYYVQTGSTNPVKTLTNLLSYHLREKIPVADRMAVKTMRHFFERETGNMNILEEMRSVIDLQKERVAFMVGFERKFNVPSPMAGKELANLTKMYGTLGSLLVSAGLSSCLQNQKEESKQTANPASTEKRGRLERALGRYMDDHPGMTKAHALESLTGISDITHGAGHHQSTLTTAVGEAR